MQKKSHKTDYSLYSLNRQNKREMGKKIPKPSCLAVIWELDREIILLHVHFSVAGWWKHASGWQKGKATVVTGQGWQSHEQDMLPLASKSQISDADFNSQVTNDGSQKVVLSPWLSSHLEMWHYFNQTNSDSLISNSGHLLITSYCLKVVLGYITKPNALFCSELYWLL